MSEAMECRRELSEKKLGQLSESAEQPLAEIVADRELCVYATGSYGRLEAWKDSDADLFLLYDGGDGDDHNFFPRLDELRIVGRLIEVVAEAGFPDFDADGKYLEIHDLRKMRDELGSPSDDGVNAFTARMLLLLESRPVQNAYVYGILLERVIDFYFTDHRDHPKDFKPLFLLNDILRFWRTLTLNYEFDRFKRQAEAKDEKTDLTEEMASAHSARKNFKLKFSRLTTCFSMVAWLSTEHITSRKNVFELCRLTPFDRLESIAERFPEQSERVARLRHLYDGFLEFDQRPKDEVIEDFFDPEIRSQKRTSATEFGDCFHGLIEEVADPTRRRYLVI